MPEKHALEAAALSITLAWEQQAIQSRIDTSVALHHFTGSKFRELSGVSLEAASS
jgi:hypothetical protein